MSTEQLRNIRGYVLYALMGATIAAGLQLSVLLAGDDPINWRPIIATFTASLFGALATAAGAATRTRVGSEGLAEQVNGWREIGFHRDDLTVLPKGGRVPDPAIAPDGTAPAVAPRLSDEDIDRLARRGLELLREQPPTEVKP